jgi:hypothetical protein
MPESKLLLVALAMIIICNVRGQSSDTLFVASARQNSLRSYELATVVQSGLFNGTEYVEPRGTRDEHPFFMTDEWQQGDVEYKGQYYKNLPLLYDVTTDRLVSELFNGQPFVLVNEHLKRFSLGGRKFIRVDRDSISNDLPAQGFYEEVYGGNTQVLVRHSKVKEERIENTTLQIYFTAKSKHYILHGGRYERITNKSGVLKVLKDHKTEVRSFIKKEKLKFSPGTLSSALAAVASYYDTLKPVVK